MPLIVVEKDDGIFVKVTTYPHPENPQIVVKRHGTVIAILDCNTWADMAHVINTLSDFQKQHCEGGTSITVNHLRKIQLDLNE